MCELESAQASSPLCTLCQQPSTPSAVNLAQPHHTRFAAVPSSQFKHMPIFLLDRQKQRITSCVFLCRTVLSWDCTATPPFTGLSQLLTVSAVVFVSQHDSISQAQRQDDMTIWPLIKEQVPLQLYTSWAAQTSFQHAIYLPLLLARCWAQTGMFLPVLCSVVHQCD